jgi:amino acid adenylation domain-containing protein
VNQETLVQHAGPADLRETGLSNAKRQLLERYLSGAPAKRMLERNFNRAVQEPWPLSFPQQQVWLHGQMASDVPFYNETITVYRHGPLDLAVLERCLLEVIKRHEIWRTTFDTLGGQPVQIIQAPPSTFSVPLVDLRSLPEADRESEAVRLATKDARLPFDLKAGPLVRILVVRMQDEQHRLYMTIHQIVFDAVTAYRVFLPELTALYEAFASGKPSSLPELPVQYGDFADWQRKKVFPGDWSEDAAYWREQLRDVPTLQWPSGRSRPAVETHRGAIERYTLPAVLARDLKSLSQRYQVSPYMTLLAAFAALLHRYTGQDDLVAGTFTAGRKLAELEPLLGYFVNPLALRIDLSGGPTFVELLSRVRTTVLDALKHEDLPFSEVVQESHWKADAGRNPLFQVVLSQQPKLAAIAPGWGLATEEISNGGSKLDLVIVVDDRGDSISGPITYNPDLFDSATIRRMIGHWQTLLAAATKDPHMRVADLPLLTEEERSKILVEWNNTTMEFPASACVHQLIEAQVERTPDAVAVTYEQDRLTYRELNRRANQLANHLRKLGVGPDVRVGICLERSTQMMIGLLGALKAGGAYVPLDPEYPKERLAFMVQDSSLACLITEGSLDQRLTDYRGKLIYIDRDRPLISQENWENPSSPVKSEHLAYVIYTSGSTGQPKGVLVEHKALVNRINWMQKRYLLTQDDVVLQKTPYSFDVSVWEFFWPMMAGASLVFAVPEGHRDVQYLEHLINKTQITTLHFVPSMLHTFLENAKAGCSSVRQIFCSGEALDRQSVDRYTMKFPNASLHNLYGPTEAAIDVTAYDCSQLTYPFVPIGTPIDNTQIYILDQHSHPQPIGVPGELHIAGDGLARGYLNRPELTQEKFVANPFRPGTRMYKTGDLARWLGDGNIQYLGRTDTQVKVRGFRIELEEIEFALRQHPAVADACAIVREDIPGDLRLVAYVTPLQQPDSLKEIRSFLKEHLPSHMIPVLSSLDNFPLTPSGKLNRRALPPLHEPTDDNGDTAGEESGDPIEQLLARIWRETLNVPRVSVYDNFFDLGGHSLLATQMVAKLERELGLRMRAKELAFQSLGQFAASCREKLQSR